MKKMGMTTWIIIAMVVGIAAGGLVHAEIADPATQKSLAGYVSIGSMIFLRLIKMIIAPLVFSTLVVGIGHMNGHRCGRPGGRQGDAVVRQRLARFADARADPGKPVWARRRRAQGGQPASQSGIDSHAMTLDGFIKHVFPDSAIRPMVDNEILQIVVFSMFFGVACAAMGKSAPTWCWRGSRACHTSSCA